MPFDFTQHLVIGVSSRALFDLELENKIYDTKGLEGYSQYQIDHEDDVLEPGVAFPLVRGILKLNLLAPEKRRAEVIMMSRNNADTSLRIWKS